MMTHDGRQPIRYYEAYGEAHDALLRCVDCQRLVRYRDLQRAHGCPKCGNRRVKEVNHLSLWEWLRIRMGWLNFPHRQEFLREFGRG